MAAAVAVLAVGVVFATPVPESVQAQAQARAAEELTFEYKIPLSSLIGFDSDSDYRFDSEIEIETSTQAVLPVPASTSSKAAHAHSAVKATANHTSAPVVPPALAPALGAKAIMMDVMGAVVALAVVVRRRRKLGQQVPVPVPLVHSARETTADHTFPLRPLHHSRRNYYALKGKPAVLPPVDPTPGIL